MSLTVTWRASQEAPDPVEAVEAAQRSPGANDLEIARMKKQKLQLKEEITRLAAH
jgi:hypothetical protein